MLVFVECEQSVGFNGVNVCNIRFGSIVAKVSYSGFEIFQPCKYNVKRDQPWFESTFCRILHAHLEWKCGSKRSRVSFFSLRTANEEREREGDCDEKKQHMVLRSFVSTIYSIFDYLVLNNIITNVINIIDTFYHKRIIQYHIIDSADRRPQTTTLRLRYDTGSRQVPGTWQLPNQRTPASDQDLLASAVQGQWSTRTGLIRLITNKQNIVLLFILQRVVHTWHHRYMKGSTSSLTASPGSYVMIPCTQVGLSKLQGRIKLSRVPCFPRFRTVLTEPFQNGKPAYIRVIARC